MLKDLEEIRMLISEGMKTTGGEAELFNLSLATSKINNLISRLESVSNPKTSLLKELEDLKAENTELKEQLQEQIKSEEGYIEDIKTLRLTIIDNNKKLYKVRKCKKIIISATKLLTN